jgi:hypothetical protein
MAYVTATNGETFFLWPMPEGSARGISPGIEFNDVSHELGNGYWAQELYGSEAGLRTWEITQNTLGGDDCPLPYVTGVTGEEVSQEKALWGLYCHQKRTGKPFAYTCPRDGNTYLVRFNDTRFQYEKEFNYAQYAGKITVSQVREDGVTIFDLDDYVSRSPVGVTHARETGHSSPNWGATNGGNAFVAGGTVTFGSNAQNGHNTVRLNGTSGYLGSGGWFGATSDIIIAMTVRSATFAANSGLVARGTAADIIKGTSGGTKWQNPSLTDFEYTLNGQRYDLDDMQAPMDNVFGVCHFRATSTNYMDLSSSPIFGRSISSAFGAYVIGEIVVAWGGPLPYDDAALIVEHLCVKWAVNT